MDRSQNILLIRIVKMLKMLNGTESNDTIQKSRYVSNRHDRVSINKHLTIVLFKKNIV